MKRTGFFLFLLFFLAALVLVYIFANSMQSGEGSIARSDRIIEKLQPIFGVSSEEADDAVYADWNFFVRKSAHIIEFGALGILIGGGMLYLYDRTRRLPLGAALFCALFIGLMDEYIQNFTGRTSLVKDVLLDFAGALLGILISVGVYALLRRRKKNKNRQEANIQKGEEA